MRKWKYIDTTVYLKIDTNHKQCTHVISVNLINYNNDYNAELIEK